MVYHQDSTVELVQDFIFAFVGSNQQVKIGLKESNLEQLI
jgi:hypothetical protein